MDGFQEDLKNHYEQGWQDREASIIRLIENAILHFEKDDFYAVGVAHNIISLIKKDF